MTMVTTLAARWRQLGAPAWLRRLPRRDGMRRRDIVRFAVSQIRESKTFFYANVIAIGVGVLLIVVMLSIAIGLRRYVLSILQKEAAADLIEVRFDARTANTAPLTAVRTQELARIPGVRLVVPAIEGVFAELVLQRGSESFVSLASMAGPGDPEIARYSMIAAAPSRTESMITVPESVARQIGFAIPAAAVGRRVVLRLTRSGTAGEERLDLPVVVGAVARQTRFSRCYLPLPLMKRIVRWQETPALDWTSMASLRADDAFVYETVLLYATSVEAVDDIRKTVESRGYRTASILDTVKRYRQIMWVTMTVLLTLGGIALFTGSISIFNASYASVMRRMQEFAVYKTYGATRAVIMQLVVSEAVITAAVAGVLGFAAAAAICLVLQHLAWSNVDAVIFPIEWWEIAVAEGTACAACVAAAIGPARVAARLTPVEALRA
jgi:ABC-type lipoprotein release transport system permease subunit